MKIGLLRIHHEPGEKRDFLPSFVKRMVQDGAEIILEEGYGSGMGISELEYLNAAGKVSFSTLNDVLAQEYVMVLRCPPENEISLMKPGSCLISMLHYPTRPLRIKFLKSRNLEAISLDSIKDDSDRRLVENLRAVAWNGLEVAFNVFRDIYPLNQFEAIDRPPIRVTVLGAGAVGKEVVQAAVNYGNVELHHELARRGIPGVQVTVCDYDLTPHSEFMVELLQNTDILVDATQRRDPTSPVISNNWIGFLRPHAVIVDLSVDPYDCTVEPPYVKGIEGIPQGNLDQYIFPPDDPAFDRLPACVSTHHRRYVVSCYSWPGIRPKACMEVYGRQLAPVMRTLIQKGGLENINPKGRFFERAITRARLSRL